MRRAIAALPWLVAIAGCSESAIAPERAGDVSPAASASASASAIHRVIHVDASAAAGGDGSGRAPYASLADAVTQVNGQGGGAIEMAPGLYTVSRTIHVLASTSIRGANEPVLDASGLPTGELIGGIETRIVGATSLGALPVLAVGRPDGPMSGVTIANVTLQAPGVQGTALEIVRVQDMTLRDNIFSNSGFAGINVIASSGRIKGNYITLNGCGACIAAGNAASPATVEFKGNRSVRNTLAGLLLNGSGTTMVEPAGLLVATVRGNDIGDNSGSASLGYGIRVFVIRRDPPDAQATGSVEATFDDNRVANNKIGFVLDAGFPYRTFAGHPDSRTYSGSASLSLHGNVLTGNATTALFTFTRSTAALNQAQLRPSAGNSWKYFQDATYSIMDPDLTLASYKLDHPVADPFDHRTLHNVLTYNGTVVPNGRTLP